jgi:hypothetical protein
MVERQIWFVPLLALCIGVALSQVTVAMRLNVEPQVFETLAQSGALASNTERENEEAVATAHRIEVVTAAAKAVLGVPLAVVLLSAAVRFAAWLLGRKTTYMSCFSAVAVALLPIAAYHVILFYMAYRQPLLLPRQLPELLVSSAKGWFPKVPSRFGSLLDAVDFFRLWSVLLLWLGLSQALTMSRTRALVLTLVLFSLFTLTFFVGLPAMAANSKGAP